MQRQDFVDLQHKLANYLASVFDILFALNRMPHPGEKRLIDFVERQCRLRPSQLLQNTEIILGRIVNDPASVVAMVDQLTNSIELLLKQTSAD